MRKSWLLLMLFALLLAGCDGSGWKERIPAQACPSGNVLELYVGARTNPGEYASYGGSRFRSELSTAQIVQRGGSEDFTVQKIFRGTENAGVLLTVQREKGKQDFYWLRPTGQDGDASWYCFTGLRVCLRAEDGEEGEQTDMLFPGFALDPAVLDETAQELTLGQKYRCNTVTIGERAYPDVQSLFAEFYHAGGWYDVEQKGDTLTVREKGRDAAALRFTFDSENGETYLTAFYAK